MKNAGEILKWLVIGAIVYVIYKAVKAAPETAKEAIDAAAKAASNAVKAIGDAAQGLFGGEKAPEPALDPFQPIPDKYWFNPDRSKPNPTPEQLWNRENTG